MKQKGRLQLTKMRHGETDGSKWHYMLCKECGEPQVFLMEDVVDLLISKVDLREIAQGPYGGFGQEYYGQEKKG